MKKYGYLIMSVILFLGGTASLPIYNDVVMYLLLQIGAVYYIEKYILTRRAK